jgi:choline dehydrogenase-like flavoprotein
VGNPDIRILLISAYAIYRWMPLTVQLKPGTDDRPATLNSPQALEAAQAQFKRDGTGPLAKLFGALTMGWWRPSEKFEESEQYKSLSSEVLRHLNHPTVPTWELVTHTPPLSPLADPSESYLTVLIVGMLPQSKGTVTLSSCDPQDAPISDPNLFSNEFDRQILYEATRTTWNILTHPSIAKDTLKTFSVPKSLSDEDIWSYAQDTAASTWHMCGTAKMGQKDDTMSVVDTSFKVKGLKGLRIADMSVTPFAPNCHTMAVAYQIGEMCAERLIGEYGLDD